MADYRRFSFMVIGYASLYILDRIFFANKGYAKAAEYIKGITRKWSDCEIRSIVLASFAAFAYFAGRMRPFKNRTEIKLANRISTHYRPFHKATI